MPGEYFRWKARDVQPDKPIELTKAQKRANWWHYHKWHVVIGAVLVWMACDIGKDVLGIGEVRPDVSVAYVGSHVLPIEAEEAIEQGLASMMQDVNGDGKVTVVLNQYPLYLADQDASNAQYAQAQQIALIGDLEDEESFLFLLEDPERFQRDYDILAFTDGSLPVDAKDQSGILGYAWVKCPAAAGLQLGEYHEDLLGQNVTGPVQRLLEDVYISRRGYWREIPKEMEAYEQLWKSLVEGAQE